MSSPVSARPRATSCPAEVMQRAADAASASLSANGSTPQFHAHVRARGQRCLNCSETSEDGQSASSRCSVAHATGAQGSAAVSAASDVDGASIVASPAPSPETMPCSCRYRQAAPPSHGPLDRVQ